MNRKPSTGQLGLLLWIQKITVEYGLKVDNFTTSFKDGRAMCALVHFYFPNEIDLAKGERFNIKY